MTKKGLGRKRLDEAKDLPKCRRKECRNQLTLADVKNGYKHCSSECFEQDPDLDNEDKL